MEEGVIVCVYYRKLDEDHGLHKNLHKSLEKESEDLGCLNKA